MQNKIIPQRFQKSQSNTAYYRSIRYKTNTTTIAEPHSLSKLPYTNTLSKHQNYSNTRKQYSLSTGKVSKFKRYSTMQNQQPKHKQKKMSYLQTWRTLLDKIQLKGVDCKIEVKANTVALPSIREYENSQFTALDPLALPMQFMKSKIKQITQQFCLSTLEMKKLKGQIFLLRRNIQDQLNETSSSIMNGIDRMKKLLTLNRVQQQQMNLRKRRQCQKLLEEDQNYKKKFESAKEQANKLQEIIFQNRPFQLENTLDAFPQQIVKYF